MGDGELEKAIAAGIEKACSDRERRNAELNAEFAALSARIAITGAPLAVGWFWVLWGSYQLWPDPLNFMHDDITGASFYAILMFIIPFGLAHLAIIYRMESRRCRRSTR